MNKALRVCSILLGIVLMISGVYRIYQFINDVHENVVEARNERETEKQDLYERYAQVEIGMTYDEVKSIMGKDGRMAYGSENTFGKYEVYLWDAEDSFFAGVEIHFDDGLVSSKTQLLLEPETPSTTTTPIPSIDITGIETEYLLTAGYYTAGIDIPVGKCDVLAIEGSGNLNSSNWYDGGVNTLFGIQNGYNTEFKGLKLPQNVKLFLSSDLKIKLTYTKLENGFSGRKYDESRAITLSNGNYIAGEDFESGTYNIVVVSGNGTISTSNLYDDGVNDFFGIDDDWGLYTEQFLNLEIPENVEISVSSTIGQLTVKLIPEVID